jgi:hypothetical protein
MPRKEKTVAEVFIGFCMTAKAEEIAQLITTAQTIVNTRFPIDKPKGKPRGRSARKPAAPTMTLVPPAVPSATQVGPTEAAAPAPVMGKAQQEAVERSPRRRRPPIATPASNGAGGPEAPAAAAGTITVTLPPQDTPDE